MAEDGDEVAGLDIPADGEQQTLRDLWAELREENLPHEALLFVEMPDGKGGVREVPVTGINWSKTSWGDDKLLFGIGD